MQLGASSSGKSADELRLSGQTAPEVSSAALFHSAIYLYDKTKIVHLAADMTTDIFKTFMNNICLGGGGGGRGHCGIMVK